MGRQAAIRIGLTVLAACWLYAGQAYAIEPGVGEPPVISAATPRFHMHYQEDDGLFASLVNFGRETLNIDYDWNRNQLTALYRLGPQSSWQAGVGVTRLWAEDASAVRLDRESLSIILRYSF